MKSGASIHLIRDIYEIVTPRRYYVEQLLPSAMNIWYVFLIEFFRIGNPPGV